MYADLKGRSRFCEALGQMWIETENNHADCRTLNLYIFVIRTVTFNTFPVSALTGTIFSPIYCNTSMVSPVLPQFLFRTPSGT